MINIPSEVIFSVLRTLKGLNPGDLYYDNYLIHYRKYGDKFRDFYHFVWEWVIENKPKKILEIGTRTGISICQLLSAYIDSTIIEKIVLSDLFNDGFISPDLVKFNLKSLNIDQTTIDKVEFLLGDSKKMVPNYARKNPDLRFDFILVDGDHTPENAKVDLENVKPLIAQKGVIVFDDIAPDGMSLDPIWQEFKTKYKEEFEWQENYDGKGFGVCIKK